MLTVLADAVADCKHRSQHASKLSQDCAVCLIPFGGIDSTSVAPYIAEVQRILAKSGLVYEMHGYGTGVEGEWDDVCRVIGLCHERVHAMGAVRISTDLRIGTRTGERRAPAESKVRS
jgi:uncharacterized protein (TIGR00106 family)